MAGALRRALRGAVQASGGIAGALLGKMELDIKQRQQEIENRLAQTRLNMEMQNLVENRRYHDLMLGSRNKPQSDEWSPNYETGYMFNRNTGDVKPLINPTTGQLLKSTPKPTPQTEAQIMEGYRREYLDPKTPPERAAKLEKILGITSEAPNAPDKEKNKFRADLIKANVGRYNPYNPAQIDSLTNLAYPDNSAAGDMQSLTADEQEAVNWLSSQTGVIDWDQLQRNNPGIRVNLIRQAMGR